MPAFDSSDVVGQFLWLTQGMKNGSIANFSMLKLPIHTGTHVDAPGHVFDHYFDAGFDVDNVGRYWRMLKSLHIPRGVHRMLFRTLNTDGRLMFREKFDSSYVGFMKDGAQWLVDNTYTKLVGIDYLSVAAYDDLIPSHLVFLEDAEVILVEGLKLDDVPAGVYDVYCLPLRLLGAEGSPIRCILIK